jgi:biopolymer transport protein ExbD
MAALTPQPPDTNDVPDREAKRQLKRFRATVEEAAIEHQQAYLNITPMMDMMTILLVFLLKQFSVEQAAASMSEGLQLPTSTIEQQRPLAVNVTVTQNAVLVEGDAVAVVRSGAVDPSVKRDGANGYYITPLVDTLNKHGNCLKKIAAMGGTQFDGTAMILIDKNTPYRLLTEVLYSAGQAEFRNYHLVVIKKSQ